MTIEWLFAWYNLIFVVPFLLALLYVGIYAVSGLTFGDTDVDASGADVDADAHVELHGHVEAPAHIESDAHFDADADTDAHFDADADADAHVDADADVDADIDADAHVEGHGSEQIAPGSVLASALSLLGVGRVPLSIVLMVLMLIWGTIGFFSNLLLWEKYHNELFMLAVSFPLAFVGSFLLTKLVTGAIARWLPTHETYVQRRHELLGAVGEAILPIDSTFGMAAVRDVYGDLFHIGCRLQPDQPPLEKGTKVKLVAYNGKQKIYYVTQYDPAVASRTA
jgi:hypothetical protein